MHAFTRIIVVISPGVQEYEASMKGYSLTHTVDYSVYNNTVDRILNRLKHCQRLTTSELGDFPVPVSPVC